jgi:predicted ester cyclase
MGTAENKALVRQVVEQFVNRGDIATAEKNFHAQYRFHPGDGDPQDMDREEHKAEMPDLRRVYPDLKVTIEEQVAEGDLVATRVTMRGTHKGELRAPMGAVAPTGKQVTWTGITIHRIRDGKVAEGWINYDALGVLQQVGAVPEWSDTRAARRG